MNISKLEKVIQLNFVELTNVLDIGELLDNLYQESLLCVFHYELLRTKTRVERNYDFFLNIHRFGEAVERQFQDWLSNKHKELYHKLITTDVGTDARNYDRKEEDQNCIRKQMVLLLKRINANAIVPQLYQDGLMNQDDVESIYILPTRKKRAHHLLMLLTTRYRGPGLLTSFTKALRNYQPHLCDTFLGKA